ncbi:MAG: exo-alpha-sialidase [Bacteroidales bacterium]|nr:exo-alpha-sialidase [Bacteroidales bacterium]
MDLIADVYIAGEYPYGNYRIPSTLLTVNGTLLAFAEARKELNDHAENKIVLKRSLDAGKTWSELQKVADAGRDSLNNPLAVQDSGSGKIILMYQHYPFTKQDEVKDPGIWKSHADQRFPPNIHEAAVQEGYEGDKICRTFMISSEDDGATWTAPLDLTRALKRPQKVTSYAGGPGIGIQVKNGKHKGRIIMPFSHGPWSDMKVYTVYSDDQGGTWKRGQTVPSGLTGMPNEVQMVELKDGRIMLNARPFKGKPFRMVSFSRDGGDSWSELNYDGALPDPDCQGSIIRLAFPGPDHKSIILFSNPAHHQKRINGTIRLSEDEGKTWKWSRTLYKGSFAYSCLVKLTNDEFGILFERDDYSKISYCKMKLKWLTS